MKKFSKETLIKYKYEVNTLTQYDILTIPSGSFGESIPFINEPFFEETINSFFKKEDLLPEKYHIPIWKDKKALIITDDPFGEGNDIDKIKPILDEISIPSEAQMYIIGLKENCSHFIFNMDKQENISAMIEDVEKTGNNHKIIKISFKLTAGKTDVLNLNDENDIKKFKEQFSD